MPRAKRTARADARRRYRAAQNVPLEDEEALEAEEAPTTSQASSGRAAATPTNAAQSRPSIARAFRSAFRPVDLPGDLRALPRLLIDKAFWIPAGAIVVVAAVIILTAGAEVISRVLFPYFLLPPPIAPVFLAGFLAPRASWLLGVLIGVVQTVVLIVVATAVPGIGAAISLDPAYTLVISIGFGAFYAAAAAWYKRFLQSANPPRRAAATSSKSSKPKSGGASSSRPFLARKR